MWTGPLLVHVTISGRKVDQGVWTTRIDALSERDTSSARNITDAQVGDGMS